MRFLSALVLALPLAAVLAVAGCGGDAPQEVTLELEIEDRSLKDRETRLTARQDDTVTLMVKSDEAGSFHLHGYDLSTDVGPGGAATLEFTANATGSFPLELHLSGAEPSDEPDVVQAPAGASVSFQAVPDTSSGLNISIATTGFTFTPEEVGGRHTPGRGHAHIYVDGVKAARIYGNHYYLSGVEPGERLLRVTLNANTHEQYAIGSQLVEAAGRVTVAPGGGHEHDSHDSGEAADTPSMNAVEAPAGMSALVEAEPDPVSGVNVKVTTTGFTFAPENVDGQDVEGEGHAHVYVDGHKVGRLYGPHHHLGGLGAGDHEIRVILNTNSHAVYAKGGEAIEAVTTVQVASAGDGGDGHDHSHDEPASEETQVELGRLEIQPR